MAGFLLLGWLSSRLGWEPGPMTEHKGGAQGKAKAHKHEIKLTLEPDDMAALDALDAGGRIGPDPETFAVA